MMNDGKLIVPFLKMMLRVVGSQSYVIIYKKAFQQLIFHMSMFSATKSRHFKTSLSRTCSSSYFR